MKHVLSVHMYINTCSLEKVDKRFQTFQRVSTFYSAPTGRTFQVAEELACKM